MTKQFNMLKDAASKSASTLIVTGVMAIFMLILSGVISKVEEVIVSKMSGYEKKLDKTIEQVEATHILQDQKIDIAFQAASLAKSQSDVLRADVQGVVQDFTKVNLKLERLVTQSEIYFDRMEKNDAQ